MEDRHVYDYIIIGQGLAGSLLSWFLVAEGKKVLVLDPGGSNASRVAAGLMNPLTGRRMTRTWMAETLFPFAEETYTALEQELQAKFFHLSPMVRFFPNADELAANEKRVTEEDRELYGLHFQHDLAMPGINPELKHGVNVSGTGWLDTITFLTAYRAWLQKKGRLMESRVRFEDIKPEEDGAVWRGRKAGKIIFCEGFRGVYNPWFGNLPYSPAKGEILTIHAPDLPQTRILLKGLFIIPIGDGRFRAGATYAWDELTERTTPEALQYLEDGLRKMLNVPFTVLDQQAGIRPAAQGRRPLMGLHPEVKGLGVFNGLGTKGVTLGPWFARHFARHLMRGEPILPEVDISQYTLL